MTKTNLKWYIPENFDEAYQLHLKNPSIIACGGTTGILRTKNFKNVGFINLKNCNLSYIKEDKEKNLIKIGAMTTFNEVIDYIKSSNYKENKFTGILLSALSSSASYPLRNRITIGGSLFDLPIWSDLISPLLLANVDVIYNDDKKINLLSYIEKRKSFPHIIKEIEINYDEKQSYFTQRYSLTNFDYAVFRFSFSYSLKSDYKIESFVCAISGTKNIVFFNEDFNSKVIGESIDDEESLEKIILQEDFGFSSDFRFDSDYKEQILKSLLLDAIKNIKE
jgi:CO/xanthine dehydrogenase FAD-binding subunit